jgi:hypothetical protein
MVKRNLLTYVQRSGRRKTAKINPIKEDKMFHNRSSKVLTVLVATALVTLIFGTAISTPQNVNEASDTSRAVNLIDWFLQHGASGYQDDASSNATDTTRAVGLIDWFLQHGGSGYQDDASAKSTLTQPNAPIEGWVYLHDSVNNKWYAYPATTPPGIVFDVDNIYELRNGPGNSASACGLSTQPDC